MAHENYDPCFPDQPVVDLYLPIWAKHPTFHHKPAFIWAEDGPARSSASLTYDNLNSSVQTISSNLLHSLQRGDTVVILCGPGLALVEIIFACQRAGLAVPATPPNLSLSNKNHHHLARILSQTKPKAVLATRGYINLVGDYTSSTKHPLSELLNKPKWIAMDELKSSNTKDNVQEQNLARYNGCKADDVYLIQYTSGATGIPKPVLVTAGAAAHNVREARKSYHLHPNSVIVSWLPQYHDCGLMFLLLTVVSGATCVLTSPSAFIHRPRLWLELITEYRATCTPVPSFTMPLVVKRGGPDKGTSTINLGTMKNLILINEPIYKASIDEFLDVFGPFGLVASSISPSYGLAENCTFVSTAWRSENDGVFPVYKNLLPSAKLEMLEEEIEILIVNEETHEVVNDGVEGEIWISSPSKASGYLDHPSLTRQVFNSRLKNRAGGCFFRTGDRGIVFGHERYLYVTGRSSDMIKRANGVEIHPHFIETAAYNSCPRLLRPGCVAAFGQSGSIVVVAELQREDEDGKVLKKLSEGIRDGVWSEERIEVGEVILVKSRSVPKTTSGKIQRWAAKYGVEKGGINEVMRIKFGSISMVMVRERRHGNKERERKRIEVGDEREGILLAPSGNRPSLLSSL